MVQIENRMSKGPSGTPFCTFSTLTRGFLCLGVVWRRPTRRLKGLTVVFKNKKTKMSKKFFFAQDSPVKVSLWLFLAFWQTQNFDFERASNWKNQQLLSFPSVKTDWSVVRTHNLFLWVTLVIRIMLDTHNMDWKSLDIILKTFEEKLVEVKKYSFFYGNHLPIFIHRTV